MDGNLRLTRLAARAAKTAVWALLDPRDVSGSAEQLRTRDLATPTRPRQRQIRRPVLIYGETAATKQNVHR
jgi:hypothetical protein